MDALEAILTRSSVSALTDPGPSRDVLAEAIKAAAHAPDHGRLRPWRFIVIEGEKRHAFGEVLAKSLSQRDPKVDARALDQERARALRAPTIVAIAAATQPEHPKIPEIEQILSAGAAAQNFILALHVRGFGTMWKTGPAAYDPFVKTALGLKPSDHIVGFVYAGSHVQPSVQKKRPDHRDLVREWAGAEPIARE